MWCRDIRTTDCIFGWSHERILWENNHPIIRCLIQSCTVLLWFWELTVSAICCTVRVVSRNGFGLEKIKIKIGKERGNEI